MHRVPPHSPNDHARPTHPPHHVPPPPHHAARVRRRFRGVFTAIVTPFTRTGAEVDFGRLDALIAAQAQAGVGGIVVAGTTGESPTITHEEHRLLLTKCVDLGHAHGLTVIAGTGSNATAHAVELQREAAALGADAGLSVNPYYNKPTQEGLYRHFMTIANAAELPVMLYNIPGRTGVALSADTIERLAKHPNIQALKEASGSPDSCGEAALRCPDLDVLSGDDTLTLPFMSVGAVGVVSVLSNVAPAHLVALVRAVLGDLKPGSAAWHAAREVLGEDPGDNGWKTALMLHRALIPLARSLFLETNPIPVKAALRLLGRDSGAVRLPMTEAAAATCDALRSALDGLRIKPVTHAHAHKH